MVILVLYQLSCKLICFECLNLSQDRVVPRAMTGENWNVIMRDCMIAPPFCNAAAGQCGWPYGAAVYWVTFQMWTHFLLINVVVAIVIQQFEESQEMELKKKKNVLGDLFHMDKWRKPKCIEPGCNKSAAGKSDKCVEHTGGESTSQFDDEKDNDEEFDGFKQAWQSVEPTLILPVTKLQQVLQTCVQNQPECYLSQHDLDSPVGFKRFLVNLNLPSDGSNVHYLDVLYRLAWNAFAKLHPEGALPDLYNETCELTRAQVKRDFSVLSDVNAWRHSVLKVYLVTLIQRSWRGSKVRRLHIQKVRQLRASSARRATLHQRPAAAVEESKHDPPGFDSMKVEIVEMVEMVEMVEVGEATTAALKA
jgi:hypothetical protein